MRIARLNLLMGSLVFAIFNAHVGLIKASEVEETSLPAQDAFLLEANWTKDEDVSRRKDEFLGDGVDLGSQKEKRDIREKDPIETVPPVHHLIQKKCLQEKEKAFQEWLATGSYQVYLRFRRLQEDVDAFVQAHENEIHTHENGIYDIVY